jgi:Predicted metal-binding protein related to the C-terminal domain of SecA
MSYVEILNHLKTNSSITFDIETKITEIENEKKHLKTVRNENELLLCWFAITALTVIQKYQEAFVSLKRRAYKEAWDIFERVEISIINIQKNSIDYSSYNKIKYIEKYTEKFQSLYPYKVFGSPEMLNKKVECSICGSDMNPFTGCNHIPGRVYMGEMCYSIVKEMEFISISMVTKPVQKYSAMYDDIDNPSRYPILEYIVPILDNAYIVWDYEVSTKYKPHSDYNIGRNDKCPCLSGKKYKKCCLPNKDGVPYPHYEFLLPDELIRKYHPTTAST